MSYQIFYDRAFIRVKDLFIPIVNSGSNNCWEVGLSGRDIPEKEWEVLNHTCRSKFLFTADEIREQAKIYEEISQRQGTCFKSRYRQFGKGEFESWIKCGMNSAFTTEEYYRCGNVPYISEYYSDDVSKHKTHYFKTTDELINLLEKLKDAKCIDIRFENNREIVKPRRASKNERIRQLGQCYVLKKDSEIGSYFCSFRKNNTTFCGIPDFSFVRAFPTEKAALKYLEKYKERLGRFNLKPVLIETNKA